MARRIVVFGATGYTGRLIAERLAKAGARPVLAARSERKLDELVEALGYQLETRKADVVRANSVMDLLDDGDVLVSTVGPFAKWGEPAVRAAIGAGGVYLDSTGEPQFIRRIYEHFDTPAKATGAALLTAQGYDYVPGALAAGLALREAGEAAVRADVGYFMFGEGASSVSAGTKESMAGALIADNHAFRDGALQLERAAARVRDFSLAGKARQGISIGGAEHFTLPAAYPRLREVNVYIGMPGAIARPLSAATLAGSLATRVPGASTVMRTTAERMFSFGASPAAGELPGGESQVVAIAYDEHGGRLAEVHLRGPDGYAFTAGFIAWAAQRAARGQVSGSGAIGPIDGYGLDALEAGCRAAGLVRTL